jgi:hypothetical protein
MKIVRCFKHRTWAVVMVSNIRGVKASFGRVSYGAYTPEYKTKILMVNYD